MCEPRRNWKPAEIAARRRLAAPDELALSWLYADAVTSGLRAVPFHESDLGGALTAVALEPAARRLVAHLPPTLAADTRPPPAESVTPVWREVRT